MKPLMLSALTLLSAWALSACRSAPIIPPNPLPAITAAPKSPVLQQVWQLALANADSNGLTPAVVGNAAFVASAEGKVYRLTPEGNIQWQVSLAAPISAGVGAHAERLAVATQDGVLHVLNATDGKEIWQQALASEILGPPTLSSDRVIIRTADGLIIGYDARTGSRAWLLSRPIGALSVHSQQAMLVLGDRVVAGGPQGILFALNPQSGEVVWEQAISRAEGISEVERLIDITSAPASDAGARSLDSAQICAATFNGKTACVRGKDGLPLWQADVASSAGLALGKDRLWVVGRDDTLYALALFDGKVLWQNSLLKGRALGSPILTEQGLMLGDGLGFVLWFNPDNGQLIGSAATPGAIGEVSNVKINPRQLAVAPLPFGQVLLMQSRLGSLTAWR